MTNFECRSRHSLSIPRRDPAVRTETCRDCGTLHWS